MNRLTLFCLSIISFFYTSDLHAQGWEAGIFFGISHYQGDLQRSHVEILEARHGNGLFARYGFTNRWAVKGHYYQGAVSGGDGNYPDLTSIRSRNLSFTSVIREVGVQLELTTLNFLEMKNHWKKSQKEYRINTYVFGGISGFYFNPKAYKDGYWYELQPLGTEGQGMPGNEAKYSRYQVAIPMGFGGKFHLTNWSTIGFEIGFRKTFTDYIDDVSGYYPDLEKLAEINPMAASLSYRSPEFAPETANPNPSGTLRGSVAWDDSYIFAGITAAIKLSRR